MTTVLPLIVRMAVAQLKRHSKTPVAVRLIRRYLGFDAVSIPEANDLAIAASKSFNSDTFLAGQVVELMTTFADHMDAADLARHQMESKLSITTRQFEQVTANHRRLFDDFAKVQAERTQTEAIRDLAQQRCHDLEGVVADQAIKLMHQGLALKTVTTELQQAREMLHNAEQTDYQRAWNEDGGYADYASAKANGLYDTMDSDERAEYDLADLPF